MPSKIELGGGRLADTPRSSRRWPGRHGRIIVSPVVAQNSSRLLILRLGGLQILIRYIDLVFQRIELRILKYRPPVTAKILVIGLGGLPVPYLFIGGRSLHHGRVVLRANHASSQLEHCQREQNFSQGACRGFSAKIIFRGRFT